MNRMKKPPRERTTVRRSAEVKTASLSKIRDVYVYEGLTTSSSTRFLMIKNGDYNDPIECTMVQNSPRHKQCRYMALSYVWGNSRKTKLIFVNGRKLLVTETLYNVLLEIRSIHDESTPNGHMYCGIYWWIDAICIDQQNLKERGHQVAMMRDIYRSARKVVAWLGFGCSCKDIPSRDYWWRVWITQEVVVNKNVEFLGTDDKKNLVRFSWDDYEVLTGFKPMARTQLSPWLHLLPQRVQPWRKSGRYPEADRQLCILKAQYQRADKDTESVDNANMPLISLKRALEVTHHRQSSDPRDKIFAVLGMIQQGRGKDIVPDYTSSACSVYCSAIRAMHADLMWEKDYANSWWLHEGRIKIEQCRHRPFNEENTDRDDCDGLTCGAKMLHHVKS